MTDTHRTTEGMTMDAIAASITIRHDTNNGLAILAMPPEKFNCAEFTLKDSVPQQVLIAPWIQFEPSALSDWRQRVATEIARRAMDYTRLLAEVERLRKVKENTDKAYDDKADTVHKTIDLWRAERVKYGLPEDFSDIKTWPPEMMADYRRPEQSPEPPAKPVPCWCPYCDQPHSSNIRETSPAAGPQPCKCPNTTTECSVTCGCQLGSSYHCRALTKRGSEPDANCFTAPDGECMGGPCMHDSAPVTQDSVAVEREACAALCELLGDDKKHSVTYRSAAYDCMNLIRGRGAHRT